jgi:para-nitrobenzyl esterase
MLGAALLIGLLTADAAVRADGPVADDDAGVAAPNAPVAPGPFVALKPGWVEGLLVGTTREFLGIPYATAPVGERRFLPPQPIAAWYKPRLATAFGPSCPQPASALSIQGPTAEDCLFVNVYAPQIDRHAQHAHHAVPVMVYIHGGAFMRGGSASFDGRALSEAGQVVVVTFNYRLGPLGFLSHPALDAKRWWARSGNDGMRDQQLALQFVHDNIAAFGGDPSNITVFGESAGSVSTCLHSVAPDSRALAQHFIMESGSCVGGGYGTTTKQLANERGMQLAEELCPSEPDVVGCLRQQTIETLVNWQSTRQPFGANWTPAVDRAGGLLPDTPEHLIEARSFEPGELLLGTNKSEWQLYVLLEQTSVPTNAALATLIEQQFGADAPQIETQYASSDDTQASATYVRLMTDIMFRCPTRTLARLASWNGDGVYLYSFAEGNAYHGSELDYVFARGAGAGKPEAPSTVTQLMQGYWTRFAATGDPNGAGSPDWPRYHPWHEKLMTLVDAPQPAIDPSNSDCEFWEQFVRNGGVINLGL